ncbi:3-carboxy-cis,cis-mucoante lactonizing enzyme [Meira miltonrushii]|uniref:3-carboxy-cis,cis-mucoante lactonizing enzyme n=1 Tax=Meira miltonrushii TaxID=1280837 RepID=A0A316VFT8_9BASI|nr:3-carboxy-cis,cis-mucoante lactonizing enzyme [Meira miltonrushii]PWN36497.1 3-carboxy-cis,cis-mucoante lactonizing enzyme [Meira miltonrushii]
MSCSNTAGPSSLARDGISSTSCPRHRHLISGTFNSNLMHILSFDTLTRTLSLLSSLPAYGPHSFLTAGRTVDVESNRLVDTVYATTWAEEKELCAWKLDWQGEDLNGLKWLGNVPITATSSYVHPGSSRFLYSAGGPTGEVHSIDQATGAIQEKVQEIIFLKEGEKALPKADKTRVALRYGAHNVDIGQNKLAFIADVGRNSILTYKQDSETGMLHLLTETFMVSEGDGPRHVVPSPDGQYVYSVTEHTSFVDVYHVGKGAHLEHLQRVSILPSSSDIHQYRGDTVRLSPDGQYLFATTRGKNASTKGFVKVWQINHVESSKDFLQERYTHATRNSGGKANAIEFAPRYGTKVESSEKTVDYAVLTDDQEGYITVLEWDGEDLKEISTIRLPLLDDGQSQGASQAIWVS